MIEEIKNIEDVKEMIRTYLPYNEEECIGIINNLQNEKDELSDRIVKASRKIDKFKETYIICFDKPLWDFVKRLEKCLKSGDE